MDKEDIKTCKEEAENYIEFMETAGDNAGWTRGLMWYIQHLEQKGSILDKVTDKLKEIDTKYTNEYKNIEKLELIEGNTAVLQELSCVLDDIYEILNIAKGEKK